MEKHGLEIMLGLIIFLFLVGIISGVIKHSNLTLLDYQEIGLECKTMDGKVVGFTDDEIFIDTDDGRYRCELLYVIDDVKIGDNVVIHLESAPSITKKEIK
jgi:hypothetical protein